VNEFAPFDHKTAARGVPVLSTASASTANPPKPIGMRGMLTGRAKLLPSETAVATPAAALFVGTAPAKTAPSRFDLEGRHCARDLAQNLRDQLDFAHSANLKPLYPPNPSLWALYLCDHFNANVDRLLKILCQELGKDFDILDDCCFRRNGWLSLMLQPNSSE